MPKFFRSLPIELYWYAICLVTVIFFMRAIGLLSFSSAAKSLPILILLYASSTFVHFFTALILFLIYVAGKMIMPSADTTAYKKSALFGSALFFLLLVAASGVLLGMTSGFIGNIDPKPVLQASNMLMRWDLRIFGIYPPFWLQFLSGYSRISMLLMVTYGCLGIVLSLTAMLLAVTDTLLLRKFLLSFTTVVIFAFPVWRAIPAISPDEMYRKNILSLAKFHDIPNGNTLFSAPMDNRLKKYNDSLVWSAPQKKYFGITAFPSMHVAWSIIVVFFLFRIKKTLAFIAVPWALLNAAGALYTLQHYAVDVLTGVAVGIAAIMAAHYLLNSKWAGIGTRYFFAFQLLQQEQWCRYIQKLMSR